MWRRGPSRSRLHVCRLVGGSFRKPLSACVLMQEPLVCLVNLGTTLTPESVTSAGKSATSRGSASMFIVLLASVFSLPILHNTVLMRITAWLGRSQLSSARPTWSTAGTLHAYTSWRTCKLCMDWPCFPGCKCFRFLKLCSISVPRPWPRDALDANGEPVEKEMPNYEKSGKLLEETNTFKVCVGKNGDVI